MNMEETVLYVNEKITQGYSIAKAERELNYGKDTLRKKFNRAGYNYDKTLKKFILDVNTNSTQTITHAENKITNKPITQNITQPITHSKTSETNATQSITQGITQPKDRALTDADFKILFDIIDMYKSKENNNSAIATIVRDDSDLTTRSFRSYKNVFDLFSKYCKDNSLNQKDAIADALLSFISK